MRLFTLILLFGGMMAASAQPTDGPVVLRPDRASFTLANGLVTARISRENGRLQSLVYHGVEFMAAHEGGYWSSVGKGRAGYETESLVLIHPATNEGARAEIAFRQFNDPHSPETGLDAEYRYELGRGEPGLHVSAVFSHPANYPVYGVGEARYCLKLNPEVFDFLSIDTNRQRLMPSGYDWDHGITMNLKEARRLTTGIHRGEVEHKYDYAAVLADTPAYGWSSSRRHLGLWLVNPSMEYLGGGPTKCELTGHLDCNPGGLPTLLNMWLGSHFGGTSAYVPHGEAWTKEVGPFFLYCNAGADPVGLWRDAQARAAAEAAAWPYAWAVDANYPAAAERSTVTGRLTLQDPFAPDAQMSNVWVGVSAPDYTNPPSPRVGGPPSVIDWPRDAKHYEFWTRADASGRFTINHIRPGQYTLHAIADGVLGEFTRTNVTLGPSAQLALGELVWQPKRFGRTVWEIGVPDRTACEFRHGDHYWQWGLYFLYPQEFPHDVDYVVGQSDWHRDWNYVQPPRILDRNVEVMGEDEEQRENAEVRSLRSASAKVQSTTWKIRFPMPGPSAGRAALRLAFCGAHLGCHVQVSLNGQPVGDTGLLIGTSAMQRDCVRAYWFERDIFIDARQFRAGENVIELTSPARTWAQGVMYDCVRLEL